MRQPWELVADALRRAISDKTYKPGDQLPSESQLAAQHRASRPTIRRALQDLRLKGLIETRQGKGAFVRMPSPLAIPLTAENYDRHRREGRRGRPDRVQQSERSCEPSSTPDIRWSPPPIRCAASPPSAFCQLKVATSILSHGRS